MQDSVKGEAHSMLMNCPTAKSLHVTNPGCSNVVTKAVPFPTTRVSLCSPPPLPDNLHCLQSSISLYVNTPAAASTSQKAEVKQRYKSITCNMKQQSAGVTKRMFDFQKQPKQKQKKTVIIGHLYTD